MAKKMSKEQLQERITKAMDELLYEIYQELDVKTGDADIFQVIQWDKNVEAMADLFSDLIDQNNEGGNK